MPNSLRSFQYENQRGERLDRWLCTQLTSESRSRIQKWIASGWVTVNGNPCSASHKLGNGDLVSVQIPLEPAKDTPPSAQDLPLELLYEDEDLLVINKAAGMVVHPAPGTPDGTVVNALLHHAPEAAHAGEPDRPGIVHRLDGDTSGVMVLAKKMDTLEALQAQFKERETQKEYRCLVRGAPSLDQMTLNGAIGRSPHHRKKMAVLEEGGRHALSHVQVLTRFRQDACECAVQIETGRTHQIRVHLSHAGFPVLGDPVYGGRRSQLPGSDLRAPRQMLHAFRLRFRHPQSNLALEIEAPLPADYRELAERLSSR